MFKKVMKSAASVSVVLALLAAGTQNPASAYNSIAYGDQLYCTNYSSCAIADGGSLFPGAQYYINGGKLWCCYSGGCNSVGSVACQGVACGANPYGPEHLYRITASGSIDASPAGNGTGVWRTVGTGQKCAVAAGGKLYIINNGRLSPQGPNTSIVEIGANYKSAIVYAINYNGIVYSNKNNINGVLTPISPQPKGFTPVKVAVDPNGSPWYLDSNGGVVHQ